ncbi:DNA-binding transcriptional LysR family regulator [Inhella inkyongensis]|uniref:DNA-binding transcriptional LysR family regulator n=1 Tax=Inhella inkyongensis TaxID=392593 RepID=A0A840S005_9BURK|nr:LysR family transcriptional regulator [Inhella inkyongensis]MBB5203585.1 DNA-binding transcriptional LysR family regulator [Inhella inkyongensis]
MNEPGRFDWSLVPSFLAVLDAGSLMGAARALQAQQPTLSRHIAQLEAQLGVDLFERTGRGVQPTAAALALAEAARQMASGAERLSHQLQQRALAQQGRVRISASQLAACYLLPALLAQLQREEPGIQIELVATDAVSNLLRREADIALRLFRPEQTGLVARKLGELAIQACAHRDYLAQAGAPRQPQDLHRHCLVGYDQNEAILKGFAAAGLPLTREAFALRTDDPVAYGQWVLAGAGVGFMPRFWVRHQAEVVALLPGLPTPRFPVWLVVHREIRGNRIVRRAFDFLAQRIPAEL